MWFSIEQNVNTMILDTKMLDIISVFRDNKPLKFELKEETIYGRALHIFLGENTMAGDIADIQIFYKTHPDSDAISWLSPEQTLEKKHPMVYSQCQTILARSVAPIQVFKIFIYRILQLTNLDYLLV